MSAGLRLAAALLLAGALGACTGEPVEPGQPPPLPSRPTSEAGSEVFHLDPSGDDAGNGSADRPWATFGHALAQLQPGSTLEVGGGSYRERVQEVSLHGGLPEKRISVRAAPGERPVLRGLLWLDRPSYWTFSGINVTWDDRANSPEEHMVKITDGVGWSWEDSEVWGARSFAGLLVASERTGEPADWSVTGSCIHDTRPANGANQDSNLYVGDMQTAGPGLVERNLFFDAPNGRNIKLGAGRTARDTGPANVTVRYNTLVRAAVPIVIAGGARNILIADNLLGLPGRGYLIRGFRLTGDNVVVRDNLGFGAARIVAPASGALVVAEGNRLLDAPPVRNLGSCTGFDPVDDAARRAGKDADPPR
jgi:hypothetical protein